jgi:AcrR family transcriptional regulator
MKKNRRVNKGPRNVPEAQRRNDILEAARRVFEKKGFHNTKIEDIAKHANIAHGTVYRYFPNKAALATEIIGDIGASGFLESLTDESTLNDPEKILKAVARRYYGNLKERLPLIRFNISQAVFDADLGRKYYNTLTHRLCTGLESIVQEYQDKGVFKKGDPFLYGHVFYGIMFGFLYTQELLRGKETTNMDIKKIIPQIVDVFLHGVEVLPVKLLKTKSNLSASRRKGR